MTAALAILLSLVGSGVPTRRLPPPARAVHRLLVISVDGLDSRYLKVDWRPSSVFPPPRPAAAADRSGAASIAAID